MVEKFLEMFDVDEWQVETDSGWDDIQGVGMTKPFLKYKIILENNLFLEGADDHILFTLNLKEIFIKDLQIGDYVHTKYGYSKIVEIVNTNEYENMFDLQVCNNHRYYSNDILSHNSKFLSNLAVKTVKNGLHTLIITLELSEELYIKRLASNYLSIDIDVYDDFIKDKQKLQERIDEVNSENGSGLIVPGTFRIKSFPTATASTIDLENYINKIQDKYEIKFNVVYIDYVNIMKNWRNPNTENTYIKIKQICEDVRAMAQRLDCCIVSATQLSRSASTSSDIQMNDVSESMGLVHTVDALFAICNRDEIDIKENVVALKPLALRNAQNDETPHKFRLENNFMRISEIDEWDKKKHSENIFEFNED